MPQSLSISGCLNPVIPPDGNRRLRKTLDGAEQIVAADSSNRFVGLMTAPTVWIVDDCSMARKLIARVVTAWNTREFDCGTVVLDVLQSVEHAPFAIIIDEQMPGLRGTVVARAMRDMGYTGVIILHSGTVDDVVRACALEAQIDCVAEKPIRPDAIRAVLNAAERRGLSESA